VTTPIRPLHQAAASLKKQGANNGATTAFLISTPESGVDSISIIYTLLDPIMTVARPVSKYKNYFWLVEKLLIVLFCN
jgi:hypothetical protein